MLFVSIVAFTLLHASRASDNNPWVDFSFVTSPREVILNKLIRGGTSKIMEEHIYQEMALFFPDVARYEIDLMREEYVNSTFADLQFHSLLMSKISTGSDHEIERVLGLIGEEDFAYKVIERNYRRRDELDCEQSNIERFTEKVKKDLSNLNEKLAELTALFEEVKKDSSRDPRAVELLRKKIKIWAHYCILPLKRGEDNACYLTERDFGENKFEGAWALYPQVIRKLFREELVDAHNKRVAKFDKTY